MRNRNIAFASGIVILLMLSSFWLGFRVGAETSLLVDAAPRGSISLFHLESIRQGGTKNMVIGLEGDVDIALIYSDRFENHLLHPLLEPVWGLPVSMTAPMLTRLANYRKSHPSPLRTAALSTEPTPNDPERAAFFQEILRCAEANDLIITRVIEKYATKDAFASPSP
jgi:hypothetical protein